MQKYDIIFITQSPAGRPLFGFNSIRVGWQHHSVLQSAFKSWVVYKTH
jgi:hypothetical protein